MRIIRLVATLGKSIGRRGATSIEYGLIAVLIAVAAIVAMRSLGTSVLGFYTSVDAKVAAQ